MGAKRKSALTSSCLIHRQKLERLQETTQPRIAVDLCDDSDGVHPHTGLQLHEILNILQDHQEENLPKATL